MDKKGVIDRIYIFIFALIVGAGLVFLGLRVISSILPQNTEVQMARFQSALRDQFVNIEYGVSKELSIPTPPLISRICFYDPKQADAKDANPDAYDFRSTKMEEMGHQGDNVFLMKKEIIQGRGKINGISLSNKYVKCFETSGGYLQLRAEGGDYGTILI